MNTPKTVPPDLVTSTEPLRLCVYTALTGCYERLNEQPMARDSMIPFICLTDDAELRSDTWQIRQVPPLFTRDPIRSQRDLKLRAHLHLPDYDFSIYIDNSVVLTQLPERIFERHYPATGLCLFWHSLRDSVLDEFLEVASRGLDDQGRVFEQLNHYSFSHPEVLEERPYWGGLLLREHGIPEVRAMSDIWYSNVLRYSRRDQLSLNLALRKAGLTPEVIDLDNRASWFHTWPHTGYRDPLGDKRDPATSLSPAVARVRKLEQRLAEATRLRDELLSSDAWRIGRRLDQIAKQHPALVRAMRRIRDSLSSANGSHTRSKEPRRIKSFFAGSRSPVERPVSKTIYVDPTDERGKALAQSGGNLNPGTVLLWRKLVESSPWTQILDIGANYGEMLINVDIPEGTKVTALEPNPRVVPFLQFTLSVAGVEAEVIPAACADQIGVARLLVNNTWSGMSRLVEGDETDAAADHDVISVPATTIDALLGGPRAERDARVLIKIDVEGQELSVIKGGAISLGQIEDFAILAEVLHVGATEKEWLLEQFDMQIYDLEHSRFVDVAPATVEQLESMLKKTRYYPQEAVLRRRRQQSRSGTVGKLP